MISERSPLPPGEGKGEGVETFSQDGSPHPNPLPKGEGTKELLGMAAHRRLLTALVMATAAVALGAASLPAQSSQEPEPHAAEKLALQEQRIAENYQHLEDVLLRMAELSAADDPRRAVLLKKAVAQSKEQLIAVRLDRLVDLLDKDQLSKALESQTEVVGDLHALMELLMSENRSKHLENEKARIREFLKRINGLIKQEKDIQGRTGGGDDPKRLAGEQVKLADKTGELAEDVRKTEEPKGEGGRGKGDEGESSQQQDTSENTAEKRLQAARQHMNQAEAKLREARRQEAVEKQEEAIGELQSAKATLEEILRQLREKEIERMLVMLEARFQKMLQMQNEVYEGTVRLNKAPEDRRTHNHEIEAGHLSGKQSQIVIEADKALLLLRDDGSAAAFIEAAEQMRDDMQQVVGRLARISLGPMTQSIEEDIIAALKEMIEALKKAQKDNENQKTSPGRPPRGMPQEPPLVDMLAELRMIRALQMRVNTRTARFAKMLEGEQAENEELVEAIRRLAEREQRIHRAARDLQMGKNQ